MNKAALHFFLDSISLTENQINEIIREYPNIVEVCHENKMDSIDLSKLHGVGPYILKVIERKIKSNLFWADVYKIFGGTISPNIAKNLKLKYGSLKNIINEMNKNPYKCLCSLYGVFFKTADAILINLANNQNWNCDEQNKITVPPDFKFSKDRCLQAVLFLLTQNEAFGNTYIDIPILHEQIEILVPECCHHLKSLLSSTLHPKEIHITENIGAVSKSKTYYIEKILSSVLKDAVPTRNIWDLDTSKYFEVQNFKLTKEQSKTLQMVCKNSISILTGSAGTGKSSSVTAIINMLKDNKKTFALAAPTGMAAKVMSKYTGFKASTIHKLLSFDTLYGSFSYNKNSKLKYDMVIIDEISMCDMFLFYHLIDAIDFKTTKLLLIGDPAQLPSIGCGNILYDLINSKFIPVNSLTKVFRTGEGGILTAATYSRMCKAYLNSESEDNQHIGNDKGYTFIPATAQNTLEKIKSLYSALIKTGLMPRDILILSAYNKGEIGTNKINQEVQGIANPSPWSNGKNISIKNFDNNYNHFYVGDLVIQTKNNYHALKKLDSIYLTSGHEFVPNGEIGIIKDISSKGVLIQFDDLILYQKEDMKNIKLAYSVSIHKS